ncbi:MAG: hypothetical protein HC851_21505 [Acaryochloris sp. RU_4_1]|nr:hypothetical protein [Acaryochloris sp. RU_4_1]
MTQKIGDLRGKIQNLIEASQSPSDAAALVCIFIEDEIGLAGNGWFDDDSLLSDDEDEDEDDLSKSYDALYTRMKRLQFDTQ